MTIDYISMKEEKEKYSNINRSLRKYVIHMIICLDYFSLSGIMCFFLLQVIIRNRMSVLLLNYFNHLFS